MKNLFIAILAITSIVLSSCSNKFSISKRRYNKGFYIASSKSSNPASAKRSNNKTESEILSVPPVIHSEIIKVENEQMVNSVSPEIQTGIARSTSIQTKKTINTPHFNSQLTANNLTNPDKYNPNHTFNYVFKPIDKKINNISDSRKSGGNSDVKLILCVILAIIIPPLGMYLWKQEADIWFIVDLILFVFSLSYFFLGPIGLLGLTAIIIALLRVFDAL